MKSFTGLVATTAAIATALVLSSCTSPAATSGDGHTDQEHGVETSAGQERSDPGTNGAAQAADFNGADVAFATGMIPHHQQAVQLSALVPDRSTNPEVVKLAAAISAAQTPEIETMKGFLVTWDKGPGGGHEGNGMGGMPMQGMVDETTMTRLESLKGTEFDKLWLTSMIGHHEGAIGMANTELASGTNSDAKKLAQQIVTAQKAEIEQMQKMEG